MHMSFTWVDSGLVEYVGVQIGMVSGMPKENLKDNISLSVSA